MSTEERILHFEWGDIQLHYRENGEVEGLYLVQKGDTDSIAIRSKSMPDAPEKIYELLRECDVIW